MLIVDNGVDFAVAHLFDTTAYGAYQMVVRRLRGGTTFVQPAFPIKIMTENQAGVNQQFQSRVNSDYRHVIAGIDKCLAQLVGIKMAAQRLRTLEYGKPLRCPALVFTAQIGIELLPTVGWLSRFAHFHYIYNFTANLVIFSLRKK